jgi:hypothetical protein
MKSFYEYKKFGLVFLMGILIFSLTGCTGSGNGTNTTTTNNNFSVVVFSDVHFNPFYDPSLPLFASLVAADADQWAGIFQTSKITAPSVWGADTNYPLLALALSSIKQNLGASPLIIFTGDILGHDFPKTFFERYYGNLGVPVPDDAAIEADVAAVAAMKNFADKTVAFFMGQVRSTVGDIPVMFAVGNADSYLGALPEPGFLSHTAELYYTQFLNGIVDHQTFLDTFTTGGYYSADLPRTKLMVIGLNTVMFNYDFGDTLKSAVDAELAWFDSQLASAKAAGKKVWLLMHIPPGADKYSTAQNNVDNNGHITGATMMWNQDYQTRFLRILFNYPGTIALTLAAHTHMDEYRIMSPNNVLEITPAIAPYFGNNPAFRVFTFSHYTLKPTDYRTLNYDLATNPEQFNSYYTFSAAYLIQGFLNDSLLQLYPELVTENAKQQLYREHYFSGHNYTVPVGNEFYPITDKTWPVYWCGIGHMDEQGLIDCVNSY